MLNPAFLNQTAKRGETDVFFGAPRIALIGPNEAGFSQLPKYLVYLSMSLKLAFEHLPSNQGDLDRVRAACDGIKQPPFGVTKISCRRINLA